VIKAETDQCLEGDHKQKSGMISLVGIVRKNGHFTNQCRVSRKHNNKKKQDDDHSANATIDEIEDVQLCSLDSSIDSWIIYSGASFHITSSLELLSNYVLEKFGKFYFADGKSLNIIGRDDINIRTSNGTVWTLNNVRHILALKINLIYIYIYIYRPVE